MSTTRKRRKMGRPTKYTPDLGARIVGAMQAGAIPKVAAGVASINQDTLYRWLREGGRMKPRTRRNPQPSEQGRPVLATLRDFSEAYKKAEDAAEVRQLRHIDDAARGDRDRGVRGEWTAAAWLLERRHPDRYARPAQRHIHEGGTTNTNVNVTAGGAGGAPVDLSALSDDELDQLDTLTSRAIGRAQRSPRGRGTRSEPPGDGEEE